MWDPSSYGPRIEQLLALDGRGERLMPLASGTCSSVEAYKLLQSTSARELFPGSRAPEAAMTGLYLYFSCLDEAHTIAQSIETPDALTAILHFREVYAPYLILFEFVLPRHVLEGAGDVSKTDYGRKPLGTGPFRVAEFAAGDHLTLERNMSYRNKDRPILDRIVFRFIASRDAAVLQLKAGEVDAMWSLLESQAADLEKTKDVQVLTGPSSQVWRLEFNLAKPGDPSDPNIPHPVLGDIAIRRALTLATPKRQIVDSLLSGKGDIANSLVSIGWAAPQDLMQESYDPAKAKEVLDRAGWTTRSDGIRAKGSTRASLTISTVAQDSVRERIEQVLLDEW